MKKQLLFLLSLLFSMAGYTQIARVQVVHNSADALAATLDVYVNGTLVLNNMNFRTASPFINLPAEIPSIFGVAPDDSSNAQDSFYTETLNLTDNGTYIIVLGGIESSTGYDPAPPFDLHVFDMAREIAVNPLMIDVLFHHGSTDAPTMDVYETEVALGQVIDDISYSDYEGYFEFPSDNYTIELRSADGAQIIATYIAELEFLELEGIAITVIASGFIDPSQNSNGPEFGLYAVSPFGGALIPLPPAVLAVDEFNPNLFRLYPNPTNETLNIDGPFLSEYKIQITDISGRIITRKLYEFEGSEVNVSSLASGIYVLSLYSGNTLVGSKKFVKQ